MARYFVWRWSNENVLAVANGEIKSWVKPQLGSVFTRHVADQILKLLSPTDKMTRICKLWSGYLQPCKLVKILNLKQTNIISQWLLSLLRNSKIKRKHINWEESANAKYFLLFYHPYIKYL